MKVLFPCFTFLVFWAIIGCSVQNPASPEIKVNHESKENQSPTITKSSEPDIKIADTQINNNQLSANPSPSADNTKNETVLLEVPLIKQNPELKFGCEVTSLAMVLKYAGINTDKLKLADELPKDADSMKKTGSGDITHWGNPDHGFVGDITGKKPGYAVYVGPLEKLMNQHLPNRTLNLTRKPFDNVLAQLKGGKPVIVWTTGDYKIPDRWESWKHGEEKINTPLDLHAVVLVGYDKDHLYINDPLSGKKAHKTNKNSFLESWKGLGEQALSYK